MTALARRLDKLEVGQSVLSPLVKQWLGWALTDAERTALDGAGSFDPGPIDACNWSQEARTWLGVA